MDHLPVFTISLLFFLGITMNSQLEQIVANPQPHEWWKRAAATAINKGWYKTISSRAGTDLYLLRCWLTQPEPRPIDEGWSSVNSSLLHYFARADDDEAMHGHPFTFSTTIVSGGYLEALPPVGWTGPLGPPLRSNLVRRKVGDTVQHDERSIHSVLEIEPDTWTLVITGPRIGTWGFHPEGRPWVGYKEYLGL